MDKIGLAGIAKKVFEGIANLQNTKKRELCIGVYENGEFREVYQR